MKWYWIVLLAIIALIIGHMIGKANANARQNLFNGNLTRDLNDVLAQTNPASGTRISPSTRTTLISRRDALLRLANPTRNSGNILLFDGAGYFNGWGYVNPPVAIVSAGTKCKAAGNYWIFDPTINKYICATVQNPY